jgi:hypothetical protein
MTASEAATAVRAGAAEVTIDIIGCARCHGPGHEGLVFKRLTYPCRDLTFWAPCPTNGEPIMLRAVISDG